MGLPVYHGIAHFQTDPHGGFQESWGYPHIIHVIFGVWKLSCQAAQMLRQVPSAIPFAPEIRFKTEMVKNHEEWWFHRLPTPQLQVVSNWIAKVKLQFPLLGITYPVVGWSNLSNIVTLFQYVRLVVYLPL